MQAEALLILLLIGAVAGFLAGVIVKGYGFGLLGNIVVGIVGAVVGGWLLPQPGCSQAAMLPDRSSQLPPARSFYSSSYVSCGGSPEPPG
jgi:uncharacterized membrane protein YeaQ/YmgE (transglycosylase-associated protein family)